MNFTTTYRPEDDILLFAIPDLKEILHTQSVKSALFLSRDSLRIVIVAFYNSVAFYNKKQCHCVAQYGGATGKYYKKPKKDAREKEKNIS